jgi:DNA polymerase-1
MSAEKHRIYLVDGSGYIFRAYHALPPRTRPDGTPVNAVYGFCNMLNKLVEDTIEDGAVSHLAVIFDTARVTFRNEIYGDYKANRPPPPEDLIPQFDIIREAVRAFNLPSIELPGFEADDIIATYATEASALGAEVIIVSSDKDLMQLVDDNVSMLDPMKNLSIGAPEVMEKFGVGPNKVIDVQALAGDSTDNVPGVPGIGVKTAALLINEYGDLDTLLDRAGEIKQQKRRENLIEFAELARVSRQLVTLKRDTPVAEGLDDLVVRESDPEALIDFLKAQDFRQMSARLATKFGIDDSAAEADQAPDEAEYVLVDDEAALEDWVAAIYHAGFAAVDTETTSLDAMQAELVGVSLSVEPGCACYIPLAHVAGDPAPGLDLDGDAAPTADLKQIDRARALEILKPMLEDRSILKIGQNIKYDMTVLRRYGVDVIAVDDTMLLSHVLDAGRHGHGMDELSQRHLDIKPIAYKEVAGTGKAQVTFDRVALDVARDYAAEDADITLRLHRLLKPRLMQEHLVSLYETIERPLIGLLCTMEMAGIKVDRGELVRLSADFSDRASRLEAEIHELAGEEFNVGSPKQLGEILFDKMSLPGAKKTKTGAYVTSADVLESLAAQGHDLPVRVVDYRHLTKLKSTYTDALQAQINPETGRVHTAYAMAGAATGRLASTDPNLQNIPVRTEEGRRIRRAFVAEPGHKLLSADYSQIELRVLAHIADIASLKEAFRDGLDIHALTASQVFDVPIEGMDPMVRRSAKAINFGIIYGMSAFGLSRQLGIPQGESKRYIDAYFERYPGIRDYMERVKEFCRGHGFVETAFGRRVHLTGINDKNPARRNFSERAAINAPIQGSAADIIKRAMLRIPAALDGAGLKARMLLQVHDELVFEVPDAEVDQTAAVVSEIMAGAAQLTVPLVVDTGSGDNWADAH